MQTGKQNKNIRSAMDGLTDIPEGYTFNNKRVWNALEQGLTGNRKGRKQMYYAAAVVIGLIGAASLYFMQSIPLDHPAIKTEAVVKEKQPGTAVIQVAPVAGTIKRVKRMGIVTSPAHKTIAPTKETATETDVTATTIAVEKSIENPIENIVLPVLPPVIRSNEKKTIQSTATNKPKARRYTVVHLNDLEPGNTTKPPQSNLSRFEFKKIIQQQQVVEKEVEQTAPDNPIRSILFLKRAAATTSIIENN